MNSEVIYALIEIVVFIVIIVITFRSTSVRVVQSKEEKKVEILNGYKKQLKEALIPIKDDMQARIAIKNTLLKKFSDEISRNIFFDKSEIREIILELSKD